MTENKDVTTSQPQTGKEEKAVALITSFSCPACASGAEKYSDLFDHGTCVNCGNPLEQFSATLTETGEKELKASFMLLYSKDDMANTAKDVTGELKQNGINVIDVHDIIDGSQTSVVSANLSFVMDVTAGVLVIPSTNLEKNSAVSTCLNNAVIRKIEGSTRLLPIYTEENISVKKPFGLMGTVGMNWDGKAYSDSSRTIEKSNALASLKRFIKENTSK